MSAATATPKERLFSEFPPPEVGAWRRAAEESLEGAPFEKKLITKLPEGIDLQPIYTRETAEELGAAAGWPGAVPFTRGAQVLGARESGWNISQELPYGTPEAFNQALLQDLNRGQNAVNLLLDIATRAGLDPDQAKPGEVGGCGLSIATVDDLGKALAGVNLAAVPVYVQAGASGTALIGMFAALLAEEGRKLRVLRGGILTDPVAELVGRGSISVSLDAAFDAASDVLRYTEQDAPDLRVIGVQGNLWAEAGGNAAQELGYSLATAVEYLRELRKRGCDASRVAPRMLFTYSLGSHLFTEISKLRAARLLWARVLELGGVPPGQRGLVCHGRSALWNKTSLDPQVNLLRATSEAFAGVVGGCESIHVAAFDETFRLPDDFSRRIARNTQIILGEECHLARVVDPAGGSWFVETLTRELAEKAWMHLQDIEKRGGILAAIRSGYVQGETAKSAAARRQAAEQRRDGIIGTSLFPNLKETSPKVVLPDYAALAHKRSEKIARHRVSADADRSDALLTHLAKLMSAEPAAKMQIVTEAFSQGATLGEVMRVLNAVQSPGEPVTPLLFQRRSASFEGLRRRADAYRESTGSLPKVFLANLGPRKQHGARADFTQGFFAPGGFEVATNRGFATPDEAATAALESGAPIVVICSTDDTYPAVVPVIARRLKASVQPPILVLAGYPAEQIEAHRASGVDEFIHLRANCAQVLGALQSRLGL